MEKVATGVASHVDEVADVGKAADNAADGVQSARKVAEDVAAAKSIPDAPHSQPKRDLVEMAKSDKKTGVKREDMKAYEELNAELSDPFPPNRVRVDEGHPGRGPHAEVPHGHVGPVDYIPITDP